MNHASRSGSLTDESGFGGCQENTTCPSAKCKVLWRKNNGLWWFMVGGPLFPVKGNLNSTACTDILDDSVLPTLWQQFGEGPFLFQHDNAPVHKARSIQKRSVELDWPAQSPDLNPIEHLWDELKRRLQARPNCPTSLAEWKQVPATMFQHLVESLPRRVEAVVAAKGRGDQLHFNAHDFGRAGVHILLVM
ncbi:unnamed protein product [Oncorhynchus mykiss]|uniref:Tc1-like transposase DDE domain-containing protein n=1 Tax=Oncorhynchus mykiss TaxID=8022 RepID=A0A061A5H6_ONCMY|nr:unnamed protein product [Oncorhynchus mykiss]